MLVFLSTIGFLQNRKSTSKEVPYVETNMLVAYGEEIYKRENCINCHTQQIEKESLKLISLDGVGGKYSNEWLYYYLLDPKAIVPNSKKTSYTELYKNTLSNDVVSEIAKEKGFKKSNEQLWNNINRQAKSLSDELTTQEINTKNNSEVLALISYIQQIPASKPLQKIDSIAHSIQRLNYVKEQKKWGNLRTFTNNETSIKKGKQLFEENCVACHMLDGGGGIGPNLTDRNWILGGGFKNVFNVVSEGGRGGKGMIAWKQYLKPEEIAQVANYVLTFQGTTPSNPKESEGDVWVNPEAPKEEKE